MKIDASTLGYRELNRAIRAGGKTVRVDACLGQRFIAAGLGSVSLTLCGTPGNALGAYLNGARICVHGNAQDACGDTMNDGEIVIHGSAGDAAGYAMRGGAIYIRGNAGYRAGIDMKEFCSKKPVMVIGGVAGSFLGEYQAGGTIIVLARGRRGNESAVGNFCGTGMHGGRIFLRCCGELPPLPAKVRCERASDEDMRSVGNYIARYCRLFGVDPAEFAAEDFIVLSPDSANPYKQLYVPN